MTIYEDNFYRLSMLLPELGPTLREQDIVVDNSDGLKVEVVESHKYTTVLRLTQGLPLSIPMFAKSSMLVRVYHDAQVAEVLSYQHHYRFQPKYEYPNSRMCQVREKQRVNEFLGEWLEYCLAGAIPVSVAAL